MTEHNGIKVGDIITAYHKGYWRLTQIDQRFYKDREPIPQGKKVGDEYSPLFHYELVADSKFAPPKGKAKKQCCDVSYCRKVDQAYIDIEVQKRLDEIEALKKGLGSLI